MPSRAALSLALLSALVLGCQRRAEAPRPAPASAPGPVAARASESAAGPAELEVYPALSPDASAVAYSSSRGGAFEIYLRRRDGSDEVRITHDGFQNFQPAFSPDGKLIVYHCKDKGGLFLVPATGGEPKRLTTFGSRPSWSPDGARIAFQSDPLTSLGASAMAAMPPSTLWTVPAGGGEPTRVTQVGQPEGGHGGPSWSPDGKRLVFSTFDRRHGEIWSVAREGGGLFRLVADHPLAYDAVISPDGRKLFYCAVESSIHGIWRAGLDDSGTHVVEKATNLVTLGLAAIKQLSISRDGSELAYGVFSITSSLVALPLAPGRLDPLGSQRPITPPAGRQTRPAFSPDGKLIAYTQSNPSRPETIWLVDRDGADPHLLTDDPSTNTQPSWLPDGSAVTFLSNRSGKTALWASALRPRREWLLQELPNDADAPRLSPDGKRVAYNTKTSGSTLNVWVAELGGAPRQITFDRELLAFPCWSPDGTLLAGEKKASGDTHIVVFPSGGGEVETLTSKPGQSWPYSFTPDGENVLFAGFREGVWNIFAVSRKTRVELQISRNRKLNAYLRYPAISPNGDLLVYEYAETTGQFRLLPIGH